jgi:lipopolysaccharide heptosyltransferase II
MHYRIEWLKRLDSMLGRPASFLARVFIQPRFGEGSKTRNLSFTTGRKRTWKVLVIRPGGIGDAALIYPLLRVLKGYFNNSQMDILAEKRNAGIFAGCPYINEVFSYDSGLPFVLWKILKKRYDVVIDSEQWHRLSAVVAYLTRAPIRVGFGTNNRSELFSHAVSYSQVQYEVLSFLNLASAITGDKYKFQEDLPFIPIDQGVISKFNAPIKELRKRCNAVAGIFSGATIPERRWGMSRFAELTKGLISEGLGIVIIGGEEDVDDSRRLGGIAYGDVAINFAGKTSLIETAAIISQLDLFVSSDTGLMHIAYGVGTPTVSLFGAGIQEKWAPMGDNNVAINKNLPCSPCTQFGYTPRCPYDVKCLREISVEEVKEAVLGVIARIHNTRSHNE